MRFPAMAVLLVPLVAGCALEQPDGPVATATWHASVGVDFNGTRDGTDNLHATVPFDPAARPAAEAYVGRDITHPDDYTLHDLMVDWSAKTDIPFTTTYYDGLGYSIDAFDGIASASNATEGWFWQLSVDGETAFEGMSTLVVRDGGAYKWTYTHAVWG